MLSAGIVLVPVKRFASAAVGEYIFRIASDTRTSAQKVETSATQYGH